MTHAIHGAVVILAAGLSRRLGFPKQNIILEKKTLLECLVEKVDTFPNVIKVLVYADCVHVNKEKMANDWIFCLNQTPQTGVARSVQLGFKSALHAKATHVLFVCADQWKLKAQHIRDILSLQAQHPKNTVCGFYSDGPGVPASFPVDFEESFAALEGDQGAKRIILKSFSQTILYPCEDAKWDLDTPEDLLQMREHQSTLPNPLGTPDF
jgi:molybdenum cofactor cytidylyltransferase